jgi:hypothetical protein
LRSTPARSNSWRTTEARRREQTLWAMAGGARPRHFVASLQRRAKRPTGTGTGREHAQQSLSAAGAGAQADERRARHLLFDNYYFAIILSFAPFFRPWVAALEPINLVKREKQFDESPSVSILFSLPIRARHFVFSSEKPTASNLFLRIVSVTTHFRHFYSRF